MKHSRNQRLSEHLLNVDEEILTNAYNVDDAEKLKAYKKAKHTNNRPVYAIRKPIRKAVWVPAVAAAACVALAVGLWQGGVFDPADIPVETPDESTTATAEATEPSEDATTSVTSVTSTTTAKSTEPSKTEPTKTTEPSKTTKHPTKTEPTKTTGSSKTETTKSTKPTKPYILVGGEDHMPPLSGDDIPSLNDRLVSPALEEKMDEYRNVNAVFRVGVFWAYTVEDDEEYNTFLETNEEYQSLLKQYKEAKKAEKKASDRLHESRVNNEDSEIQAALLEEYLKVEKIYNDLSHKSHILRQELWAKFKASLGEERISYAAKYSKIEPVIGYGPHGNGYYMELTADAINELANRGGYEFYLASEKIDLSKQPLND